MAVMIPRNTPLPAARSQEFETTKDGQTGVDVPCYQGNYPQAAQNKKIGTVSMRNCFPQAPKGEMSVLVRFRIDVDYKLTVRIDPGLGVAQTGVLTLE